MSEKAGSFPLLEHVLLLRAALPRDARTRSSSDSLAQLTPVTVITTPSSHPHSSSPPTAASLLEEEPALRATLVSFATELLQQQALHQQQRGHVKELYHQLETALDAADSDNDDDDDPTSHRVPAAAAAVHTPTSNPGRAARTQHEQRSLPRLEVEQAIVSMDSARVNPWPMLPVAKEGLFVQVPSCGYVQACRRWASEAAYPPGSGEAHGGHVGGSGSGSSAYNEQPPKNAATLLYADTQRYYADVVMPSHHSQSQGGGAAARARTADSIVKRRRNDEGFLYGYAMYLSANAFFFPLSGGSSDNGNDDDDNDSNPEGGEKALVLCVTSTSPSFNFMRGVALEAVQQLCAAARKAAKRADASSASGYASMMTAHLLQALEPFRELTDPCSACCLTPPGRPLPLHLPSITEKATFRANRPSDLLYPYLDTPMAMLLLSFPFAALRVLHALLLQESRVVFIGASAQHASACVVAATSLVSPMQWCSPIIPYVTPSHLAGSGLLDTLLAPSAEMEARRRAARRLRRAAPQSSSSLLESGGYLLGSTAALVPQLMLRLSAIASSSSRNGELRALGAATAGTDSRQPSALEKERLWIADARTGSIGVVPLEPLSLLFTQTGGSSANPTTTAAGTVPPQPPRVSFPSRTEFQRRVLKHATSQNAAIISSFALLDIPPVHDKLKSAVKSAVSADQRLAFRLALETVATLSQERLSTRGEEQEQLEALLRLIKLQLPNNHGSEGREVAADCGDGGARSTPGIPSYTPSDHDNDMGTGGDGNESDTDSASGSGASSYGGSLSALPTPSPQQQRGLHSPPLAAGTGAAFALSSSFVAPNASMTTSVAGPRPLNAADFLSPRGGGGGKAAGMCGGPPSLPVISSAGIVEVHAALLEFNAHRLLGNYRKGLLYSQSKVAGINSAAFLPENLNSNFKLAEAIGGTHMYGQFQKALLCVEGLGLQRVLRGEFIPLSLSAPPTASHPPASSSSSLQQQQQQMAFNYYVAHPRMVSLLNLFVERSKRKYGDLFPDTNAINGTSASAAVYSSMMAVANDGVAHSHRIALAAVTPSAVNAPASTLPVVTPSQHYRVPAIAFIAGYEGTPLPSTTATTAATATPGSGSYADPQGLGVPPMPTPSSSGSGGGGGGGVRKFFAKATRAVKHSLGGGGGGGSSSNSSSTSHVATVPIPVYIQAYCCFVDKSNGGGTLTTADAKKLTQLSQRSRQRTKKRLNRLAAALSSEERQQRGGSSGGGWPHQRRRNKRRGESTSPSTGTNSPGLASFGSGHAGGGETNSSRAGGGGGKGKRSGRRRHTPSVDVSFTATGESAAEQMLEEETARMLAMHQQAALCVEFAMPDGLSANEQALLASAAAAAAGEDGVAITSTGGSGSSSTSNKNSSGISGSAQQSNGGGGGYTSGMGVENEYMRHVAVGHHGGGGAAAGGGASDDFPKVTGGLGPVLCRPLPLDVIHQFAEYHPLLTSAGRDEADEEEGGSAHLGFPAVARCPGTTVSYSSPTIDVAFTSENTQSNHNSSGRRGADEDAQQQQQQQYTAATITTSKVELYTTLGTLCPSNVAAWVSAERLAEIALLQQQQQEPDGGKEKEEEARERQAGVFVPAEAAPTIATATATVSGNKEGGSVGIPPPQAPPPPQRRALFDQLFDDNELPTGDQQGTRNATDGGGGAAAPSAYADWGNFTSGVPDGFSSGAPTSDTFPSPPMPTAATATSLAFVPPSSPPQQQPSANQRKDEGPATATMRGAGDEWSNWGMQAPATMAPSSTLQRHEGQAAQQPQPSTTTTTTAAPAPGNVMDELFSFAPPPGGGARTSTLDDFFLS